jgi:hypothetical protein
VNYELVRHGYANVASYPPDVACINYFRTVEQEAMEAGIGLWSLPPPTATLEVLLQLTRIRNLSGLLRYQLPLEAEKTGQVFNAEFSQQGTKSEK